MKLYEEVCAVVHRNDIAVGGSGDQSTLGVFAPALQVTVTVLWPSNPHVPKMDLKCRPGLSVQSHIWMGGH